MKQAGLQLDLPFPYILLHQSSILQYSFSPPPSFFFLITRFSFILFCVCASTLAASVGGNGKNGGKGERGTQFSSKLSQSQSQSQRVISSKPRNEKEKGTRGLDSAVGARLASPPCVLRVQALPSCDTKHQLNTQPGERERGREEGREREGAHNQEEGKRKRSFTSPGPQYVDTSQRCGLNLILPRRNPHPHNRIE